VFPALPAQIKFQQCTGIISWQRGTIFRFSCLCDHNPNQGDVTMNKDNFEGTVRSAVGQGEKILGQATNDRSTTAQGYYDDAAGKARSAVGSAKDAVSGGVDAISSLDFSGLRGEISKLTQKVSDLHTESGGGRARSGGWGDGRGR
jgi:uncharacterized protein YjbJ (UPF0337 family)